MDADVEGVVSMNTGRMSVNIFTKPLGVPTSIGVDMILKEDRNQKRPYLCAEVMSKEDIEKAIRKIDPEKNTFELIQLCRKLNKEAQS